ncbi:MAG: twin-arginine translocase TatA/TatE family subunit [Bdellovibrionaceae bacterium]|nr:twin-arginine translocase TatA/TatE family subunit [Pseudobdellovibrionaceae bacterium]|tara:strand:- start:1686 stop:1892 length:207 start_codon:yes stop_codon:yes gene_type:complete
MFGISGEHLVILAIVLILFGPKRIPDVARTLGKSYRNFKDALDGIPEPKYTKIEDPEPQKDSPPKKET